MYKEDNMGYAYALEGIEDDIIKSLRIGKPYKKVFIDSGAANDEIIDYEMELYETSRKRNREVKFRTTAAIFPAYVQLDQFDDIDTEEFNGNFFLHVDN